MTASPRMCSSSLTPASAMRSPPIPRKANGAPEAFSSRATPDAWRSPDVSPTTNRISRTSGDRRRRGALERGHVALDLLDDAQRHGERVATVLAGHHHRRLPLDRGDEALVLETQGLALGCL